MHVEKGPMYGFSLHLLVVSLYIYWLFLYTYFGCLSLHLLVISLYIYWLFLSTFIKQPMYVERNNQCM
jgi:hypothetical protein